MKMYHLLLGCFLLASLPIWSQSWEDKGHKQFQELAYSDAIISLEKAVANGRSNSEIYAELADSYYFNANYQASAKWYQLLFKKSKDRLFIHYFRYAQVLKSIGKLDKSETLLNEMRIKFPEESATFSNLHEKNNALKRINYSGRFTVNVAPFNSAVSDFGPSYFGNQIVFASTRDTGSVFKRSHSWTNKSFTNLYSVKVDSAEEKPVLFSKAINSKLNESTAIFTKDGLTMYFTRNKFENKKPGKDSNQTIVLKIYKAEKKDADWIVTGALPFCDDSYNVAHPALSPDEKMLYFASDKPGGFGESDLYQVEINGDGSFGTPENLGAFINSFGRDTYPFISENNDLYFASERLDGFGGLDIFVAKRDEDQIYGKPRNLGEPVNSKMDDFGFIFKEEIKTGYFTSNRSGGMGDDDIYSFEELIPLPCETILTGKITFADENDSPATVTVNLRDATSNLIASINPNEKGIYAFDVDCETTYTIETLHPAYLSQQMTVQTNSKNRKLVSELSLSKVNVPFQIGTDLAKELNILPIFFDLAKSNIRTDAAVELNKIKVVLQDNPNLTIEIRSHTDSRDTFENNQVLSERRAASTANWLIENGIQKDRLKSAGFGETKLLNGCSDDVLCTEEEHQQNRRSEFIVTGN